MPSIFKYIPIVVIACFLVMSCSDGLDLNDSGGFAANPTITSSLAFFDEPAETFILNPEELNVIRDTLNIDIFDDPFVVDNLVRAEYLFEATNSINRAVEARVEFLNDDFELQHTFTIEMPRSLNNEEIIINLEEVFENENLELLTSSTQVVFIITLQEDPILPEIDENTLGRFSLRSVGTFFLNIDSSE